MSGVQAPKTALKAVARCRRAERWSELHPSGGWTMLIERPRARASTACTSLSLGEDCGEESENVPSGGPIPRGFAPRSSAGEQHAEEQRSERGETAQAAEGRQSSSGPSPRVEERGET